MSKRPDDYRIVHTLPHNIRSICRTVYNAGVSGTAPAFYYVPAPRHVPDDAPRDVLEAAYHAVKDEIRNIKGETISSTKRNGGSNG